MHLALDKKIIILLIGILLIITSTFILAHEGEEEEIGDKNMGEYLKYTSVNYVFVASLIVGILVLSSLYLKEKTEKIKWLLFLGIIVPILIATVYLAGSTIYLNLISETKGPVHWHADFEIWNCGKKIDLIDPTGLSNRVGTPVFHEHGDNRMHVEGVVVDKKNVDLHSFFEAIGGDLDGDKIQVPTDEGTVNVKNGDLCNGKEGTLQVFVYKVINPEETKNWIFRQEKIENFQSYILSPYPNIPPGDCIVIEFGHEKERTEKLCETYKAAMQRGELVGS